MTAASLPRLSVVTLVIEVELQTQADVDYYYALDGTLQKEFIGDCFEILVEDQGLFVKRINGLTLQDVQKKIGTVGGIDASTAP